MFAALVFTSKVPLQVMHSAAVPASQLKQLAIHYKQAPVPSTYLVDIQV